ncbi:MAG: class I SAM-dependent methyltransferase [Calditrichota bacterium]
MFNRGKFLRQEFWDKRYSETGFAYGTKPNLYLVSKSNLLKPGMKVLAIGDGEGRNGVWLAEKNMDVTIVDQSEVGLHKARQLAAEKQVSIRTIRADLASWEWPVNTFDAVVSIFVHFGPVERINIHQSIIRVLKSDGWLIMQSFHQDQIKQTSGGPKSVEMLYTTDMLAQDFAGLQIIELEETETMLNEGPYHHGTAAVINLLAQKK